MELTHDYGNLWGGWEDYKIDLLLNYVVGHWEKSVSAWTMQEEVRHHLNYYCILSFLIITLIDLQLHPDVNKRNVTKICMDPRYITEILSSHLEEPDKEQEVLPVGNDTTRRFYLIHHRHSPPSTPFYPNDNQ